MLPYSDPKDMRESWTYRYQYERREPHGFITLGPNDEVLSTDPLVVIRKGVAAPNPKIDYTEINETVLVVAAICAAVDLLFNVIRMLN